MTSNVESTPWESWNNDSHTGLIYYVVWQAILNLKLLIISHVLLRMHKFNASFNRETRWNICSLIHYVSTQQEKFKWASDGEIMLRTEQNVKVKVSIYRI